MGYNFFDFVFVWLLVMGCGVYYWVEIEMFLGMVIVYVDVVW